MRQAVAVLKTTTVTERQVVVEIPDDRTVEYRNGRLWVMMRPDDPDYDPGQRLGDRIRIFESLVFDRDNPLSGRYPVAASTDMMHEIRWVYSALHLMSQRLAVTVEHKPTMLARQMAARKKLDIAPLLRVVTLRRMEQDREQSGAGESRDWQWQWMVRGHWRNQWYAAEQAHKQIFVEAYMKGPADKPVKDSPITIVRVAR